MYYLGTIAAIGLKVDSGIQINELMKLGQCHYLNLAKGYSDFRNKTWFSWKLLSHLEPNFV